MTKSRTRRRPAKRTPRVLSTLPLLAIVLSIAFGLKLAVMLAFRDHPLTQPDAGLDTTAYVELARRVLSGDVSLGPGLYYVSPLYIYFLAGVLGLTNSFTAVRLVQIVLGTTAVWLAYLATREWFGNRAALFAAVLAALTGLFTFYESLLIQAALDPFLTAAALAGLALALRRGRLRWYALAGLAFGVQALNRPNIIIPAGIIALLLLLTRRMLPAAAYAVALALALSPITLRNVIVAGNWSPVASHGGLNFYIGNNGDTDGTYHQVAGITPNLQGQQADARRVAAEALHHPVDEAGASRYFYGLAWTWIRDHPAAAARLFAAKLSLVFSSANPWLNYSYRFFYHDEQSPLRLLAVGPWLLIPLGLVGLVAARPDSGRAEYAIWASFVPLYAISVAAFFVADRYTLPLLVPMCVAAGAAIDRLTADASARRWAPMAAATAALAVLALWVNRPLRIDEGVAEERTRMAERLISTGQYAEAERWASLAEQASPAPGVVHFRIGQRLLVNGQPSAAIDHFERALRFDAGRAEVEYALGEVLLDERQPFESIAHLRRAVDAGFRKEEATLDLVRALGAAGDTAGAVRALRDARPAREDDGERWVAFGELGMQLREPALATVFFQKAVEARPNLASAHFGLAAAAAAAGRLPEARLHAQEAVRLDPGSERAKQLAAALAGPPRATSRLRALPRE